MDLSGELAKGLLDAAPDPTVIVDESGTIVFANARVEEIFGYPPSALLGQRVEVLLPRRLRTAHTVHRDRFSRYPKRRPMGIGLELYGLHKDGHEFPVEISLSPFQTPAGMLVSSAIRDVSVQRETEHQLAEANRAKSRFLAAASHDLRQPLQTLNLLNRAVASKIAGDPMLEMMIARQQNALDSMASLLNSLLDISKLDAGMVVPQPVDASIDDLFARLVSDFQEQAQLKGLQLSAKRCGLATHTDPDLLRQLLGNLVANAIRYTTQGGIELRCTERGRRQLHLEVADTGSGIPVEEREKIFEEFYQIDRGSQRPEGLGLGLSIVRRLAKLLGFTLLVDSSPGGGSVFGVTVPRGRIDSLPTAVAPTPVRVATGRILIVDDEMAVAEATKLLLEIEGFEVRIAASEKEALEAIRGETPELVISDYHLRGGESGVGVVTAIRNQLDSNIPVVFVTGDTAKPLAEIHSLERIEFLTKPLRGEELLSAIHRQLAASQVEKPM